MTVPPLLTADTITQVTQIQAVGEDLILPGITTRFLPGITTRYGIVFQKADDRLA